MPDPIAPAGRMICLASPLQLILKFYISNHLEIIIVALPRKPQHFLDEYDRIITLSDVQVDEN
jgi:hypothetical protein